jgi:hypothetical protein
MLFFLLLCMAHSINLYGDDDQSNAFYIYVYKIEGIVYLNTF